MIIYKVKCSLCNAIYIEVIYRRNSRKLWTVISPIPNIFSFADHFEQQFQYTTSHTDLRKCMLFKAENHLNLIGLMKPFMKLNWNICMEELLKILNNICNKHDIVMNKNLEIYGACRHKTTFHQFFLIRSTFVCA